MLCEGNCENLRFFAHLGPYVQIDILFGPIFRWPQVEPGLITAVMVIKWNHLQALAASTVTGQLTADMSASQEGCRELTQRFETQRCTCLSK